MGVEKNCGRGNRIVGVAKELCLCGYVIVGTNDCVRLVGYVFLGHANRDRLLYRTSRRDSWSRDFHSRFCRSFYPPVDSCSGRCKFGGSIASFSLVCMCMHMHTREKGGNKYKGKRR